MQVELLDRRRWCTRVELADAIFEYLEIWRNRQRRHSRAGMADSDRVRERNRRSMKPINELHEIRGIPTPAPDPGRIIVRLVPQQAVTGST
ncbi:hypothetical protein FHU38_001507 [Saccharomonospora amisosensis]|uniref:Integrase catalytic domain-containing protein n=1 Tax=Saccharomonospora amisosensis TaxID=1128677 RepID=A0A7X5UNA4_9PSEU|nr:hypothetical protein [Saccharomonospora amisosensis]